MSEQDKIDAMSSFRDILTAQSRAVKQLVAVTADVFGFTLSAVGVYWLLFGMNAYTDQLPKICAITVLISLPLAWSYGLYKSVVRYMGYDLFVAGVKTSAGAAAITSAILYFASLSETPLRWAVAYWCISFIYICGSRYSARVLLVRRRSRLERERIIIYGAGSAGSQLARGLFGGDQFLPVAMLDDDPAYYNSKVNGLDVYPPSSIGGVISSTNASRVLLAMPTASRNKRSQVLKRLAEFPVYVQTMPDMADLVSGQARIDDIKDVDVEDLLGRDPVPPNENLLSASIFGKSVLVTGAGGSIGSELCRQIIRLDPRVLVILELSEIALYHIEKELQDIANQTGTKCEIVPLLGSVHHRNRVEEILKTFKVNTLYHAAAYKHVPVVEHNVLEGIHNNVFGTLHTAQAAVSAGVDTFVLISTDKAVSPTNVMGASKRFAELVLQAMQQKYSKMVFCMVRFGNVLESSGSVVPLFRKQIRAGGPITVTHREIIRYFMTIPEAAQLVIQAAAMARGGDVFVLDMGKPVKIVDLALRMVQLMGLSVCSEENPNGDISIEFTGLRPAEKLYEELLIGSNVSGTQHPRIMRAQEDFIDHETLYDVVRDLEGATLALDRDRCREILLEHVHGYNPTNGIEDLVWARQRVEHSNPDTDKVIDIHSKRA